MRMTIRLERDGHLPSQVEDFVRVEERTACHTTGGRVAFADTAVPSGRRIRSARGAHGRFPERVAEVFRAVEVTDVAEPLVGAIGEDRTSGLSVVVLQLV